MKPACSKFIYGVIVFLCIFVTLQQVSALTPEGTVIGNAATATYTDEDNNEYTTTSNIVQTVVLAICAVDITVNQEDFDVAPDQEVYIPVELTNISNGTRSFDIAVGPVAGAYAKTIYRDANQNGEIDPGEQIVAGSVELNMDETAYFIVMVEVPVAATAGETDTFNITATDTADNTCTETTPDITTTVIEDALIVANKQVDYTVSAPGNILTYTIQFQNIGTQPARSYDGWSVDVSDPADDTLEAGAEGILVSDELPTDTAYYSAAVSATGSPSNGYAVFSADGTNWYRNTAVAAIGGDAGVTHVGFFIPDANPTDDAVEDLLAVDQQGALTFEVQIGDPFNDDGDPAVSQDAAARVDNQAFVYYNDSSDTTQEETPTNWVHTVVPSSETADISIGGWDTVTADPATQGVKWTFNGTIWVIAGVTDPTWEEDDAAATGTGNDGDYQDDNYASNVPAGSWIIFEHQVYNSDENNDDIISLYTDPTFPDLPSGAVVEFWNETGTVKLIDNDADGNIDLGTVAALDTKDFIVRVFIPATASTPALADGTVDYFVDIQAISGNNSAETDLSRDNIDGIVPPAVDIAQRGDAGDNTNNHPSDDNTDGTNDGDDITEADLTGAGINPETAPGESKYYEIQLVNTGESPNTYSLEAAFSSAPPDDDTSFRFLVDPDCSVTGPGAPPDDFIEPNGDEYEVVDTPLLGGTTVTVVIDADTAEVANTESFSVGDSVIVGLSGTELTVAAIDTAASTIDFSAAHGAAVGDLVSESICLILAVDTDQDTTDGDYNIVVTATSSLNSNISNDMDVFLRVAAICGLSISPDHSDQLPPGGTTTYQHTVTNNGNYTIDARITITPPAGSLLNYRILDSSGAEVGGTTYDIANLAENESQTFYVKVFASSTTPVGTVEELVLTADAYTAGTLPGGAADPNNIICTDISKDTTTIIEGFLTLQKSFQQPVPDWDGYDYINDQCFDDGDNAITGVDAVPDGIPDGADPSDSAGPCDIITYQVRYTNIGEQDALNVVINDVIPEHTDYVPNTLHVDADCDYNQDAGELFGSFFAGGTLTDAADADVAEYDAGLNMVTFRVGTGADGTVGGTVVPNGTGCISFKVRIK